MAVVISVERINFWRDWIDCVAVATGQEITTAQAWKLAREAAEMEANETIEEDAPQ